MHGLVASYGVENLFNYHFLIDIPTLPISCSKSLRN
jgi:hypothetical protein